MYSQEVVIHVPQTIGLKTDDNLTLSWEVSYYKLPKVLQWFSGNIGLHHIHHLRARIPNYNLQRCYDEVPEVRAVAPLTIRTSLKSLGFNLWDEKRQKMVSFREARAIG